MDRGQIIQILEQYKEKKGIAYGIRKIGIFGSHAKGNAHAGSDVDVVIEIDKPEIFLMVHIKEELEQLLKTRVDVIRKRPKMNPYLKKHLENEAIYV